MTSHDAAEPLPLETGVAQAGCAQCGRVRPVAAAAASARVARRAIGAAAAVMAEADRNARRLGR